MSASTPESTTAALFGDGDNGGGTAGGGPYYSLLGAIAAEEAERELGKNWAWILTCGILNLLTGILALISPMFVTEFVILWIAILLIIVGAFHVSGIFFADYGFKWESLAFGGVQMGLGIFLYRNPLASLITITTIIAIAFLCDGLFRMTLACRNKDVPGWHAYMANGICSLLFSGMVLLYPESSLFVLGILVGANMIVLGIARISAGIMGRNISRAQDTMTSTSSMV